MKALAVITALAALLALAAGSARASGHDHTKTVYAIENIGFELPSAACELGVITFSLVGPGGAQAGTGASCIHDIVGCSFLAGCRDTVFADFTFAFPNGSVTAPVELDEVWETDTFVTQRAKGKISSGTGAYAGAKGSIKCAGSIEFTATALDPDLACTLRTGSGSE
jgi:hypothetical protein